MASRQVMRSVSADFCASAGATVAYTTQTASTALRSQLSSRIVTALFGKQALRKLHPGDRSNPHTYMLDAGWCRSPLVLDAGGATELRT